MTRFEQNLTSLKEKLFSMAGLVEKSIEQATASLQNRDPRLVGSVFEIERKVNALHKSVDEACLELLALQQPVGSDLRLIVAVIKMNSDLERMGDQAVNIARNTERYLKGPPLKPLVDLPIMASDVKDMVRDAIDCFVKVDQERARQILIRDDQVDQLKNKIFRDILEHVKTTPADIEQGLNLILIARNLERIGDHATNIAEEVIFAYSGEDIRHNPRV